MCGMALMMGTAKKASASSGRRRPSSAAAGPNTQTTLILTGVTNEKGRGQASPAGNPKFRAISPRRGRARCGGGAGGVGGGVGGRRGEGGRGRGDGGGGLFGGKEEKKTRT